MIGFEGAIRHLRSRLVAAPFLTALVVIVIACGVGVTTAAFAAIRALWLRPPDVPLLERIVEIRSSRNDPLISFLDFQDLQASTSGFERISAFAPWPGSATASGNSRKVVVESISDSYFEVLGLRPVVGRLLQPTDNESSAPPVVAISARLWRQFFEGRSDVVGSTLLVNDRPFTIVGVVPHEYRGGMVASWLQPTDVWTSLSSLDSIPGLKNLAAKTDRTRRRLRLKALLAADRTFDQASADISRIAQVIDMSTPLGTASKPEVRRWSIMRMRDVGPLENEQTRRLVWTSLSGVGLVILIILVTVGTLMTVKSDGERGSTFVRGVLGASRSRLVAEGVAESTLLTIAGSVLGIGLARWLTWWFAGPIPVGPSMTATFEPDLDAAGRLFCALLALTIAAAAALPVWTTIRSGYSSGMVSQSPRVSGRLYGRRFLIGTQVVAVMILAMMSVTAARQAFRMAKEAVGFDVNRLAILITKSPPDKAPSLLYEHLSGIARQVQLTRNVTSVAISSGVPGSSDAPTVYISLAAKGDSVSAAFLASTPEIFQTLGVRLVRGRLIDVHDDGNGQSVVVIDQLMAQRVFAGEDPIGRQVRLQRQEAAGGPTFEPQVVTIVGLVDDGATKKASVYAPILQHPTNDLWVLARTSGSVGPVVQALRESAKRSPEVTVAAVDSGLRLLKPEHAFQDLTSTLTAALAAFTFGIALLGLYGLLTHVALERRREIGIRLALGAPRVAVVRGIVSQGMIPVVAAVFLGVGLGSIGQMASRPAFLNAVPAVDGLAVVIVSLSVVTVTAIACFIPARRAASIDPNEVLRIS